MSKFSDFFKGVFDKAARAFRAFLSEALPLARMIIAEQLRDFVEQTVQELNKTDLNNDERRATAFNNIKGYAKTNGIDARDSLIHVLIPLAVLKFKREF